MRRILFLLAASTCLVPAAQAATILPLDRATLLAGSPFDAKVEFTGVVKPGDVTVTINGKPVKEVLGTEPEFIEKEPDVEASAIRVHGVTIKTPGDYVVEAKAGDDTAKVTWTVYGTPAPVAKNVIFMIADGLSMADRTTARLMSKGMHDGKADGRLNLDDMPYAAFIGTSSTNSIATDSANTASAYMSGNKTAVNALGVYADRTKNPFDDPKVELVSEALKRTGDKSVGIVTTAEVEDATPAALVSHTRLRAEKAAIADMLLAHEPQILLGGGSAYMIPQSTPGSKRKDDENLIQKFQDAGYALATDATSLGKANEGSNSGKILGLFHTGNMDVALDRKFLKKGTVDKFPDQPGLVQLTDVALTQLAKNQDGFFVMIEGASVDKQKHTLDWERAEFDMIEFDQAVGVAREFVKTHPDTLLIVTGDHTHGNSLIGTIDPARGEGRESVGVYATAGELGYKDENHDGFPDDVNVAPRIAMFANNYPDYYETWGPKMDGPFVPAVQNENKEYVANEEYKNVPGATFREGNLPKADDTAVHAVDDVLLQAEGAGADQFHGYMEQSDVYVTVAKILGLAPAAN
ncbi:MAG: alkaline phosphatase [Amaricoccus sp.]